MCLWQGEDPQPLDHVIVPSVVTEEGQATAQARGGDEEVEVTDGFPLLPELAPLFPEYLADILVNSQNRNIAKKLFQLALISCGIS